MEARVKFCFCQGRAEGPDRGLGDLVVEGGVGVGDGVGEGGGEGGVGEGGREGGVDGPDEGDEDAEDVSVFTIR